MRSLMKPSAIRADQFRPQTRARGENALDLGSRTPRPAPERGEARTLVTASGAPERDRLLFRLRPWRNVLVVCWRRAHAPVVFELLPRRIAMGHGRPKRWPDHQGGLWIPPSSGKSMTRWTRQRPGSRSPDGFGSASGARRLRFRRGGIRRARHSTLSRRSAHRPTVKTDAIQRGV